MIGRAIALADRGTSSAKRTLSAQAPGTRARISASSLVRLSLIVRQA